MAAIPINGRNIVHAQLENIHKDTVIKNPRLIIRVHEKMGINLN